MALMTCQKHSPQLLPKYLSKFAANELKNERWESIVKTYNQYCGGAVANSTNNNFLSNKANFNIYKKILNFCLSARLDVQDVNADSSAVNNQSNPKNSIEVYTSVRTFLFLIISSLKRSGDTSSSDFYLFERYLEAINLLTIRANLFNSNLSNQTILAQISTSLLRYIDLPGTAVDKVFFEAGWLWKKLNNQKYLGTSLVLLNRYLDLVDAIEEASIDGLDHGDLENSDIPEEFDLPVKLSLNEKEESSIKSWVLSKSMDANIEQELLLNEQGQFIGSLFGQEGCAVTGFPVDSTGSGTNTTIIEGSERVVRDDAWSIILNFSKSNENFSGICSFLKRWEK